MTPEEPPTAGQPQPGAPPVSGEGDAPRPAETAVEESAPWPAELSVDDAFDAAAPPPPPPEVLAHNAPLLATTGTPAPAPRSGGKGKAVGLAAIAVAVVALVGKIGIGFLGATVISGALGIAFGGPFERLPADQQENLEQRWDAAVGQSLDGLTDAQVTTKVDDLINGGLPRLDDTVLVDRMGIYIAMLNQADDATCAALAKNAGTGQLAEAVGQKALDALDTSSLGRWYEINVRAIEAEVGRNPEARSPEAAHVDEIFAKLVPQLAEADLAAIIAVSDGSEVPDADACAAYRSLYTQVGNLGADDLAVMALYDVSP